MIVLIILLLLLVLFIVLYRITYKSEYISLVISIPMLCILFSAISYSVVPSTSLMEYSENEVKFAEYYVAHSDSISYDELYSCHQIVDKYNSYVRALNFMRGNKWLSIQTYSKYPKYEECKLPVVSKYKL